MSKEKIMSKKMSKDSADSVMHTVISYILINKIFCANYCIDIKALYIFGILTISY